MTYLLPADPQNPPLRVDAATWGVAPGRTYIMPDDWYANHGLAPGDARWPQKPIESNGSATAWGSEVPQTLVPTPPMRDYYGTPPYQLPLPLARSAVTGRQLVTRSPFAVSDIMWGVHGYENAEAGLAGLGGDPQVNAILAKMQKQMKTIMIAQAATSAGIALALNIIPVAGQVASAIFGVVQLIVGNQNKREAQAVLADTQEKAKAIVAKYDAKLSDAQDVVWRAEADGAAQLAVSCTDLQGLGGFWDSVKSAFGMKNIVRKAALYAVNPYAPLVKPAQKLIKGVAPKSVSHVTDQAIAKPTAQMEKNINVGIDILSGQEAVKKAKAARAKILADVEASASAQYKKAVATMNTPVFRAHLRTELAIKLRSDPSILQTLAQKCVTAPKTGTYINPRTGLPDPTVNAELPAGSKAAPWAGLAAAGAVMLVLGLGHK